MKYEQVRSLQSPALLCSVAWHTGANISEETAISNLLYPEDGGNRLLRNVVKDLRTAARRHIQKNIIFLLATVKTSNLNKETNSGALVHQQTIPT
jgi:hypothetical protein